MLTREDIIKKIEERLNGKIDNNKLVEWAWEQLLNEETGKNRYDDNYLGIIAEVIPQLISMEAGPNFELSEKHFKNMITKLKENKAKDSKKDD